MALKYLTLTFIAQIIFIECDLIYISPSISRSGCPLESNYACIFLSQISDYSIMSHGSNTTLLFLPGKHVLTFNLTINYFSYFTMKSSTGMSGIQRPVISCQQFSKFQFISITSVFISNLKFTECLKTSVSKVDKFLIKDTSLVGESLLTGRAISITQSIIYVIRSSFDFFNSPNNQKGGAIALIDSNSTILYSNFTNNNAYSGSAIWGNQGTVITMSGCTFHNNKAVDKTRPLLYQEVQSIVVDAT